MTDSKPQESCITRIKKWFIAFYKAPCFWLKAIPLVILIGLAAIGLYQIVTSAFHYFSEPLSYFDPERLGQLGDFLGGTLNPIFGFATVCLLLWSVFIQRKELSLTRDELSKSASALEKQFKLSLDEYNRKQLDEVLLNLDKKHEEIATQKFDGLELTYSGAGQTVSAVQVSNIHSILKFTRKKNNNIEELIERINDPLNGDKFRHQKNIMDDFVKITDEIFATHIELMKVTHLRAIKLKIKENAEERLTNARSIFLITEEELKAKFEQIDQLND